MTDSQLVRHTDAAFDDLEREQRADQRKALLFEVLHRLADEYGVELVLTPKRTAARWDLTRDPPQLLEATVRFKRPGYTRPKRRKL